MASNMIINDREINLHIGGMAVEQYFKEMAEDASDYGIFTYLPLTYAMVITACAANWSRLNGGRKQIDRKEIIEWVESEKPTDEQIKEINEFVNAFFDSVHVKKKTEWINKIKDDIVKKKEKSSTGRSSGTGRTKRASNQKNTTDGNLKISS